MLVLAGNGLQNAADFGGRASEHAAHFQRGHQADQAEAGYEAVTGLEAAGARARGGNAALPGQIQDQLCVGGMLPQSPAGFAALQAPAEFAHAGVAGQHGSGLTEPPDDGGILRRQVAGERPGPGAGWPAGRREVGLEGDLQSAQRAVPGRGRVGIGMEEDGIHVAPFIPGCWRLCNNCP